MALGPEAFDYALPGERIAQAPAPRRGDARLLVVGPPSEHATVRDLAGRLPAGALVVVNGSRVVPARLFARRDDGRVFELLVCNPSPGLGPGRDVRAWVRGARKLDLGDRLTIGALVLEHHGRDAVDPRARRFVVREGDVLATCREHGRVPLPPYIARPDGPDDHDLTRYQTVYAEPEGSVAAPTAGLHLEPAMVDALDPVRIVLHVGPGTFLPMDVADVSQHRVGEERLEIDEAAAARIEEARRQGRPIVAVGTTVTRALETAVRVGHGRVEPLVGTTDLVITPGFRFQVVTHLLTNFHLPRSSLLMLVCAFAGRTRVLEAYQEAIARGYRFYSYGDAMLVAREGTP